MAEEPVDVLIVGAGASAAAFAWRLADTRMNILCLEQGGWMDPSAYPGMREDWESQQLGPFSFSPNVRGRREDYPVNDSGSPIAASMFSAVGGSTILYAAHFPRMHPSDFRVRTLDGVADDWPIDYQRLAPYYDINAHMMGVSGLAGDPAYPPKHVPLPPVALGKLARRWPGASTGSAGTGGRPTAPSPPPSTKAARPASTPAPACSAVRRAPRRAPTSPTGRWRCARGVRLETHCRVREITLGDDGMADGVIYYDATGTERRQKAHVVVVACNGIGTPRLLLNSRSARFPDGLANRSGLVGRNLMFHPYAMVTGIFEQPLEGYKGPTGCCIMSQEFYETDPARDFVRGYSFEILRGFGPVSAALWACRPAASSPAPITTAATPSSSTAPRGWWRSARICPIRRTASRSMST